MRGGLQRLENLVIIRVFCLSVLVVLMAVAPMSAQARPEMAAKMKEAGTAQGADAAQLASERFDVMDADKDGKVTRAEFSAYFPNMREAAFAMIDASADGLIDRDEWVSFSAGHAGGGMGKGMPVMPPANSGQSSPDAAQGGAQGAGERDAQGGLLLPGIKSGK